MSTNRNVPSPPDMDSSKYEPDLNKPKKAEFEMEEAETFTAKKGGKVGSASKRADGIAKKGKTRGKMV